MSLTCRYDIDTLLCRHVSVKMIVASSVIRVIYSSRCNCGTLLSRQVRCEDRDAVRPCHL